MNAAPGRLSGQSVRTELARAKAGPIRLAAAQLLLLRAQRVAWERRMGELLLGVPRCGRAKTPKDPDPGKAFPDGEIYLSMPRLGDRLAARVAGEIGEHPEQVTTRRRGARAASGPGPVSSQLGRGHRLGTGLPSGARLSAQPLRVRPGVIRARCHAPWERLGENERRCGLEHAAEQCGRAGRFEPQGPPSLATRTNLGEFHRAL